MAVFAGFHGINDLGLRTIDLCAPEMRQRGHEWIDVDIPKRSFLTSHWTRDADVRMAIEQLRGAPKGLILVAHSHGNNVALEVAKEIPVRMIWCLQPATSTDYDFDELLQYSLSGRPDPKIPYVNCVYSPGDFWVRLGSLVPFSFYGRAGIAGFSDPRVRNIRGPDDHSEIFAQPSLEWLCDEMHLSAASIPG